MSLLATVKSDTENKMTKSIEALGREFQKVRTGRAAPDMLDGITVDYYGTPTAISQVGNISVPEARLLMVQPWEKTMLGPIEKAIQSSDLGVNPQNDGNIIRIPIPALTEERRKDLAKECKKIAEDSKVSLRNIRRDSNDALKKGEKDKEITQDEQKKAMEDVQKITDKFVKQVDELLAVKEKDVLEI